MVKVWWLVAGCGNGWEALYKPLLDGDGLAAAGCGNGLDALYKPLLDGE